jgi:hypothetical protein
VPVEGLHGSSLSRSSLPQGETSLGDVSLVVLVVVGVVVDVDDVVDVLHGSSLSRSSLPQGEMSLGELLAELVADVAPVSPDAQAAAAEALIVIPTAIRSTANQVKLFLMTIGLPP